MHVSHAGLKHRLWVVLPARGINQGKSRLAAVLEHAARARLNRWLLQHSLSVVARWQGDLSRCIVVSACAQSLRIARHARAVGIMQPRPSRGLNRAVDYAVLAAITRGARRILVLPSDLPQLSVAALDVLVDRAAAGYRCVIAPDRAGSGTNALLLNARARFPFEYGPESQARHIEAAHSRGWDVSICVHPDLALDIDTPQDLVTWGGRGSALPALRRMV